MRRAAAVAVMLAVGSSAFAQQTYRAPRTVDGHPDLQGIWQALNTAVWNIEDHAPELGVPGGLGIVEGGEIPYLPSALALRQENFRKRLTDDPEAKCYMAGVPRITYMPYPFQIVQQGDQVTILYEYVHTVRNIYLNSPHPKGPIQWWRGDSRGRWEGETLVADVVHFTDRPGSTGPATITAPRCTSSSAIRARAPTTSSTRRRSRIRRCFRGRGRSACRSTAARNATCGFWSTSARCISRRRRTALLDNAALIQRASRTALTWKLKGWPT